MTEEERDAVKDVINDKIEQAFKTEPKKEESVRFRCNHCPISFTMKDNLNEHLLRKHKVKVTNKSGVKITPVVSSKPNNNVRRQSVPNVKFEKVSRVEDENDENEDPLTSTPERKKSRRSEMKRDLSQKVKVQGRRTSVGNGMLAETDENPGDGLSCPLCQKEFKANGPMRRHFEDIHQPGEFPCRGCNKVFSSKNKMSSHYSRNCKARRSL